MEWEDIMARLTQLFDEEEKLATRWEELKSACAHPRLPKREKLEEHRDLCPDCGQLFYLQKATLN